MKGPELEVDYTILAPPIISFKPQLSHLIVATRTTFSELPQPQRTVLSSLPSPPQRLGDEGPSQISSSSESSWVIVGISTPHSFVLVPATQSVIFETDWPHSSSTYITQTGALRGTRTSFSVAGGETIVGTLRPTLLPASVAVTTAPVAGPPSFTSASAPTSLRSATPLEDTPLEDTPLEDAPHSKNIGRVVGLSIGSVVLLAIVVLAAVIFCQKRRKKVAKMDLEDDEDLKWRIHEGEQPCHATDFLQISHSESESTTKISSLPPLLTSPDRNLPTPSTPIDGTYRQTAKSLDPELDQSRKRAQLQPMGFDFGFDEKTRK